MNNGLFDPVIVSFVFTPLTVTGAVLFALWWRQIRDCRAELDAPGLLLTLAVRATPEARRNWGQAMLAELETVQGRLARWSFALGGARVALFPPSGETLLQPAGRSPIFGMLSVALPPLGLPFIYFVAVLIEAIGGNPLTSSHWSNPDAMMIVVKILVLLTLGSLVAGVPFGLAGWLRRERMRWLSAMGLILSVCIFAYFLSAMRFLSGGD
ncbi:MAG: hypothetical protein SF097_15365 [Acidobacteriota bacterium]|nr:hypothetical protein [Acidobacteriota bacterium]